MPRPLPESAKRLEELLVAHGEKSEQAMQELAEEFSTELQSVESKIVTELKGVIEAIQKIGVESTDVSAGNPFGLDRCRLRLCCNHPLHLRSIKSHAQHCRLQRPRADDSSDDDAIAGDTQRW